MNKPHEIPAVPRKCEFCGSDFMAFRGEVNRGRARFCSVRCARRPIPVSESVRNDHFLARIARTDDTSECWLWTGGRNRTGYGTIYTKIYGEGLAHRKAFRLFVGEIPTGMFVCHHCDNPPCCNPNHLFLGNFQDNMTDMAQKKRGRVSLGESNPRAILTDDQVIEIRRRRRSGEPRHAIAADFGISGLQTWRVVIGANWKHIP